MMNEKYFRKQVKALRFSLLSPDQIKKVGKAKVVTPELYDIDGFPVDGGLMDLRLGAIDPGVRCRTCGKRVKECPGHPGMVELARPILHIKYMQLIELSLRSFCHQCGKLTLPDEKLERYTPGERAKKARDQKQCVHCIAMLEKVSLEKPSTFFIAKKRLSPIEVRDRLVNIPDEELKKIGVNARTCRPEWAVMSLLLVPSVTSRPSITLDTGERSEDDLTHKLSDIIRANQRLWENLNAGAPEVIIEDLWDLLQYHVTTFFDNNISKIPPARHRSGQPLKTITERIKGKGGRIRQNLAGKRVNYSSRTVISPDPKLKINEIGIPFEIARIITVSETVTTTNLEKMKELIRQGSQYPGANYVIRTDGRRKKISEDLKEEICAEIQQGYKVERHLQEGDIVLFNRHPSLHKQSLMAHFVKVLPDKTFRLHPAAALPYNADYDGDEMNIHSPQNEEARAEAKTLLNVDQNIISSKNNMNLVGIIKDAITGAYILSGKEIDKSDAEQLLFQAGIESDIKTKTVSGRDMFAYILPKDSKIIMPKELTASNSFGEEGELVKQIDKEYGRDQTINAINNAFALGTNYLSSVGYTLSIRDLDVSNKVKEITAETIEKAKVKTDEIIKQMDLGTLEAFPGKTVEETREIKILQALNEVRSKVAEVVKENFPSDGNVNKMITPKASGSMLNITQIGCVVGQQALGNQRINFGYTNRTLPFFKKKDLSPESRGFIKSSFLGGLNPQEFFFGAITGRDSLMDTALRTPKSGYLYRRLANAFQDLKIAYDGTVRDASENVIQFKFGGDGKDVAKLHLKDDLISPGEAIGIITAQSFGEASTQMVLNVLHHAGIAEMQVTLGLPRLIEILDARKQPSTPQMEIYLDKDNNNEKNARILAEKIKEVKLEEIASEIDIDLTNKKLAIKIDGKALKNVHIGAQKVIERLKDKGFEVNGSGTTITLTAEELDFKQLYKLKEKLKGTIISGVKNVSQVVVAKREKDFVILTSGSNLKDLVEIKGIDKNKIKSNDLHDVAKILGIEAARQTIINEVRKVIDSQGLDINKRHISLIADAMTASGIVKGVTRMGIISDKASILARATFETPDKQFVNATIQGGKDELKSVIENILLNQAIPVGTGLPGLLVQVTGPLAEQKSKNDKKE